MSRVPDDDLRRLVSDPIETALVDGASVESTAAELLALRARVVGGTDGPDQGDPAAAVLALHRPQAPYPGGPPNCEGCQQDCAYCQGDHAWPCPTVLAVRAPGAVAAAPPGDEDPDDRLARVMRAQRETDVHEWLSAMLRGGASSEDEHHAAAALDMLYRSAQDEPAVWAVTGALSASDEPDDEDRAVAYYTREAAEDHVNVHGGILHALYEEPPPPFSEPAPPAGHEDEAAVERAARALAVGLVDDWETLDWDTQEAYREDARAALAAARGPRTPDPRASA